MTTSQICMQLWWSIRHRNLWRHSWTQGNFSLFFIFLKQSIPKYNCCGKVNKALTLTSFTVRGWNPSSFDLWLWCPHRRLNYMCYMLNVKIKIWHFHEQTKLHLKHLRKWYIKCKKERKALGLLISRSTYQFKENTDFETCGTWEMQRQMHNQTACICWTSHLVFHKWTTENRNRNDLGGTWKDTKHTSTNGNVWTSLGFYASKNQVWKQDNYETTGNLKSGQLST